MTIDQRVERQAPQAIFLVNHYMSGIHAGIQAAHAAARLMLCTPQGTPEHELLMRWDKEPWMMLYNGGFDCHLEEAATALEAINTTLVEQGHASFARGSSIPFARFHEGQGELRGTLTAVAFVLPGEMILGDERGRLPRDFRLLLGRHGHERAAVARDRVELSLEYRLNLLFKGLEFAR